MIMGEPVDQLIVRLEEVTAHMGGVPGTDLEQMAALLRRRAALAHALQAEAESSGLTPAQAERMRAIVAAGAQVMATLRQTSHEYRSQLRDLYRESILVQALAPGAVAEPCEIDCHG
ncbi:MAG: hypothetical protein IT168_16040 [Bryobacterales bacterium]|nr:hypothetical protein [Bryobacterales bacterium]